MAALRWADVDLSDGDDVVVTVRRSKTDPTGGRADVRRLVGGGAPAVRSLHAAISPPTRSTAGSPQPAPRPASRGGGTSHGGRVGLDVELYRALQARPPRLLARIIRGGLDSGTRGAWRVA